ncbi:uncharacterized protein LOC129774959 [Toxorhynchites rutilus septentrionalis]|uniref:uncharacterized protein LOC129774959 n=1 Tax=Toxorhynchites rutilus septentrionalis TaxID=329112 RepID=UPI00247AEA51|nr:uncharacterized protein LOC129774959 [Toxorhynchites rutilus septentrionalis]
MTVAGGQSLLLLYVSFCELRVAFRKHQMTERWTSEQNVQFVELYKHQPNLWNCLDPIYKNREWRKASLEHIRDEMGLQDTNDVTRKIKNLRSTYNQELLKIQKAKQSGEIYKPTLKWFDTMDWIMNIIHPNKKNATILEPHHVSISWKEFYEETSDYNNGNISNDTFEEQSMKPPKRLRISSTSERKLLSGQSNVRAAGNELSEPKVSAPSPVEPEDECDVFGRHVALQLRQLPSIDRIEAIDEIHTIISAYRKKALRAGNVYSESGHSSEPDEGCPAESQSTTPPTIQLIHPSDILAVAMKSSSRMKAPT